MTIEIKAKGETEVGVLIVAGAAPIVAVVFVFWLVGLHAKAVDRRTQKFH